MHTAIYVYTKLHQLVWMTLFFFSRVFVPSTVSCVIASNHRVPAASLLRSPSGTIHSLYRAVIAQSPNTLSAPSLTLSVRERESRFLIIIIIFNFVFLSFCSLLLHSHDLTSSLLHCFLRGGDLHDHRSNQL